MNRKQQALCEIVKTMNVLEKIEKDSLISGEIMIIPKDLFYNLVRDAEREYELCLQNNCKKQRQHNM